MSARTKQIGRRACLLLVLIVGSWVIPALGGAASAAGPVSPASTSGPTYHYFHTFINDFTASLPIKTTCSSYQTKDSERQGNSNWAEGYSGYCHGSYTVATTTAPFKGPLQSIVGWSERTAGAFNMYLDAQFYGASGAGPAVTLGKINGWMSGRNSGEFHITSADVADWHADSPVTTPDMSGAAAGTKGGPLSISVRETHGAFPDLTMDISGYLLYSTPTPPLESHFFRVHFDGSCTEAYGIGDGTCNGHFDSGSSPGFADEDGTVRWGKAIGDQSGGFYLLFEKRTPNDTSGVECYGTSRSSPDCTRASANIAALMAEDGDIYPGTAPLHIDVQGSQHFDLSGFFIYASWVPAWPPK